jgi:mono/diheme cytochrome c family protein
MRILKSLLLLLGIATAAGLAIGVWYVKTRGFSAREKPGRLETYLARQARRMATPPGARGLKNPLQSTPLAIAEGRDHFADHCATCHANNGDGKTQINDGLYPPAPDMREPQTQDLSDAELFYIVKHGVRFTGMPGWGGEDDENWKLVLFIRRLPQLSAKELELMREIYPEVR